MGAMKDMALHPVCFRKGCQSQNDPDIQIGKDMIIHPDFMTSSQPVSFCALKVWYLVEMRDATQQTGCLVSTWFDKRQAVVAASPSLKQAGVPDPSTIWMHHSGKIWTGNWGCVFSHTFRSVDRVSCLFWLYYRQSIRTEQEGLESILTWMVGAKSNVLPVNARHAVNHDIFWICETLCHCLYLYCIHSCLWEGVLPMYHLPSNSRYLCSANSASGNFWWMQDGTSSYQEVFQAESFKIWVLWNFTREDTSGVLIVARVVECGFWWPVMIVENHISLSLSLYIYI